MAKRRRALGPDEPLRHPDHRRPVTRRDFLAQGFLAGAGMVTAGSVFSLFANPRQAYAALSGDLADLRANVCGIATAGGAGKIPFICFDLAGGANIAGSNVLAGERGGQLDFLSTAGYSKLGLPGDMIPSIVNPATNTNDFVDSSMGLAFHSESAMLRGIVEKAGARAPLINGAIIPARSDNDTGNNPHNPMFGIAQYAIESVRVSPDKDPAYGGIVDLIGSNSSDSGGRSMSPAYMIDLERRPTKVDRPSDVTGMIDTGKLIGILEQEDAVAVMEAVARISDRKLGRVSTRLTGADPDRAPLTRDEVIKELIRCGYVKSADLADRFGNTNALDPLQDPDIIGPIFTLGDMNDREFRKTASVMKMVVEGHAGAGTIAMGGYDYHTGDRATGEIRDLRAGRCIGACIEYAARKGMPLMVYVFSDGSVASNGRVDDSQDGGGKGEWTGDNSSTAASFILVYNPNGRAQLLGATPEEQERHRQIGWFRSDASVDTSSSVVANNVNLLVESVILNYAALHDEQGQFTGLYPDLGLRGASAGLLDSLTAFAPIVNGRVGVLP